MTNNNKHSQTSQHKFKKTLIKSHLSANLSPLEIVKSLTDAAQDILKVFLDQHSRNPHMQLARAIIAERAECSEKSVTRAIKEYDQHSFLFHWKPANEATIYKLENILTKPSVLKQLKKYFKILIYFESFFVGIDKYA